MTDPLLRLAFAGLSPRRVDTLHERWGNAAAIVDGLRGGRITASDSVRAAVTVSAEDRTAQLAESGVSFLRAPEEIPLRLARSSTMPRWLFVKGRVVDQPTVAIIGTRRCTQYGIELATGYGEVAAADGWAVVSGLAKGIDHAAHIGAIGRGGHCVAVLGSGIDVVYPRRHRPLHDQILDGGGAVLSEFPLGTRPDGWRFPTRNRIIVGLSDVVLVVEAGATGGALITARIALDHGVPVFATPGDVDRTASIGTNSLIRDGAFPVFDTDDFRQVLDLITPLAFDRRAVSAASS